jgi:ABC-type Fe3+/spermidine/putrescine transport system ATPase subunit
MSLDVHEVSVLYGANCVLEHVSLSAAGGEFIALLGASGCGKTTLLRAICGFVAVASGQIAVGGRDITRLPPDKRNVAMVFQSYALRPHMTVAQNIGYGLRLRGVGRAEIAGSGRAARDVAARRAAERKVTAFRRSARRVALGARLPSTRRSCCWTSHCQSRRADLARRCATDQDAAANARDHHRHVTHDRQEAMVMADRIVILDGGRTAQIGAPEEIYNRPNSPFVASFMGAGNVVPLRVRREGQRVAIGEEPISDGIEIDTSLLAAKGIEDWPGDTLLNAHFRSEDGRLCPPDQPVDGCLVLRGEIVQCSYPGGFYRYAVRVGPRQYLVDDMRRLAIGEPIGIALPAAALHLYRATPAAGSQQA